MKKMWFCVICFAIGLFVAPATSFAVTAQQLHEMLGRGDKVTIIDIRSKWAYAKSHIPGAINIPARIIATKRLPSLGTVIVCGDGIRTGLTLEAVQDLNAKTGICADMLEGGFGAWDALNLPNTRKSGLGRERLRYLSYQDFEKAAAENPDMVLVDLRRTRQEDETAVAGGTRSKGARRGASRDIGGHVTDLSEKFPGLDCIKLDRKLGRAGKAEDVSIAGLLGGRGAHHRKLYVLIDDGDGVAQKIAHRLKAAGIRRVVILAGGEQILRREGRPGLKRQVSGN